MRKLKAGSTATVARMAERLPGTVQRAPWQEMFPTLPFRPGHLRTS